MLTPNLLPIYKTREQVLYDLLEDRDPGSTSTRAMFESEVPRKWRDAPWYVLTEMATILGMSESDVERDGSTHDTLCMRIARAWLRELARLRTESKFEINDRVIFVPPIAHDSTTTGRIIEIRKFGTGHFSDTKKYLIEKNYRWWVEENSIKKKVGEFE